MAHKAGYTAVMSHRSGETEDFDHRRPRGRHQLRADQDRLAGAFRSHREIQSAPAHRGGTWRPGDLCRARGVQGLRSIALGSFPDRLVARPGRSGLYPVARGIRRDAHARAFAQWTSPLEFKARRAAGLRSERLRDFVVPAVDAAAASETPFYHLVLDRVFPDDVYAAMLANMPEAADYRPMHGRTKGHDLADGTHTRVKIDLFPNTSATCRRKSARSGMWSAARCARGKCATRSCGACAPARAPLWPRLRQDRHVSDPGAHPRHSRLSDHAAHRHALEGHHRPALPAARSLEHAYRHHFPPEASRWFAAEGQNK